MKKLTWFLVIALSVLGFSNTMAQSKVYHSAGGELIFSYGTLTTPNDVKLKSIPRFTGFFHFQSLWNYDPMDAVGFYSGLGLRNVGVITEPTDSTKIKQRSYALGIPLGIKIGSMDKKFFVYMGGEAEIMFHYKQKDFLHGKKVNKFGEWFSDRTNMFNPSVFAGVQLPGGMNVKFKYYLFDFLNQDYVEKVGGIETKPYDGLTSQMVYVSVGFNVHKRKK